MTQIEDICSSISNFSAWKHAEKIKLFGWYLMRFENTQYFSAAEIEKCFERLRIAPPSATGPFLHAMVKRRPQVALKNGKGFCLERRVYEVLDSKYGHRSATVHVHKLLSELPDKIPSAAEKAYLQEALICFKHRAFRAAIVMCWNLAYDHLLDYIVGKHLQQFNSQLPISFPKAGISSIGKKDDFAALKESQVLQVCKSSLIIADSLHKILKEKLDRRNVAAHPSSIVIPETTAEEVIKDLVENVILKLV